MVVVRPNLYQVCATGFVILKSEAKLTFWAHLGTNHLPLERSVGRLIWSMQS